MADLADFAQDYLPGATTTGKRRRQPRAISTRGPKPMSMEDFAGQYETVPPAPPPEGFPAFLKRRFLTSAGLQAPVAEPPMGAGKAALYTLPALAADIAGMPVRSFKEFQEATRPLTWEEKESGVRRSRVTGEPFDPIQAGTAVAMPFALGEAAPRLRAAPRPPPPGPPPPPARLALPPGPERLALPPHVPERLAFPAEPTAIPQPGAIQMPGAPRRPPTPAPPVSILTDEARQRLLEQMGLDYPIKRPFREEAPTVVPEPPVQGELLDRPVVLDPAGRPVKAPQPTMTERERLRVLHRRPLGEELAAAPEPTPEAPRSPAAQEPPQPRPAPPAEPPVEAPGLPVARMGPPPPSWEEMTKNIPPLWPRGGDAALPGQRVGPPVAPSGSPGVTTPSGLWISLKGRRYPVASMEDASTRYRQVIETARTGYSETPTPLIVDDTGQVIGHVAYNGKVFPGRPGEWKPGLTPLYDPAAGRPGAPSGLPAAPAEPPTAIQWRERPLGPGRLAAYVSKDRRFWVEQRTEDEWLIHDARSKEQATFPTFHEARQWASQRQQAPPVRATPPPRAPRAPAEGADVNTVNVDNPAQVARYVRGHRGVKVPEDLKGEFRDISFGLKNQKGKALDELAQEIADAQGLNAHDVQNRIVTSLRRFTAGEREATPPVPRGIMGEAERPTPPEDIIRQWQQMDAEGRQATISALRAGGREPGEGGAPVPEPPAPPAPRGEPTTRFEPTPEGMQGVLEGAPGRAMPPTGLKPEAGQRPIGETPLFGGTGELRQEPLPGTKPGPPREPPVEAGSATEITAKQPPTDVPVEPGEWAEMTPKQRQSVIDLFRLNFDEKGFLDLSGMIDGWKRTWKRLREKFPLEGAVLKARPNSPVISEVERWNTGLADGLQAAVKQPWWKGMSRLTPDAIKDAEEAAVQAWQAGGSTPAAAQAARRHFPPEIQASMARRDQQFARENQSRAYFGLDPIPEQRGPYLPRRAEAEAREAVSLGGGQLGVGRALQTTVRGHQQERVFETYRAGEQAGTVYEDPRNAILLREWEGLKLRATHRLFQNLEQKGTLFRDRQRAVAASPTGRPWRIDNAPGGGTWWTPTEAEAKFLRQNLTESMRGPTGTFVGFGNQLIRNPSLINPAPHIVKNMAVKALLARGPVTPYVLARDAVEFVRGANPRLLAEFEEAMPFSASGRTAGDILGHELRRGPVGTAVKTTLRAIGSINRPSQKVIFQWADPAMRYSLFKHYRGQGLGVYEAGNHAWIDLIRYGTRSSVTDTWKAWPLNFFVPWRWGTFTALVKQVRNHPVRTALLIGAVDYLREVRYRADGRWTHLPWDYVQKPIAVLLQSGKPTDVVSVFGTTAMFGPGGDFSAKQITEAIDVIRGRPNAFEWDRLKNAFWGISQLFGPGGAADEFRRGNYGNMLAGLLLGEHRALSYQPRRLQTSLPEWLPGMKKSPLVREAETLQAQRQRRREQFQHRREQHPPQDIEERLRARGYLR